MLQQPVATITEAEAQLYDRQIRLWGLDAQKRLRSARVLIAGMRGLGNEVAKNLVLAGINSLKILDHETLTKEDGVSSFLAPTTSVGKNRAQASLERLKQRNPMVEVTADEENLEAKNEEFFKDFDVVIVTNYPKDVVLKVNQLCRNLNIKFFSGDIFGYFGYSFMDLVKHDFVEEDTKTVDGDAKKKEVSEDEPSPAKKAKVAAADEDVVKMVKKSMEFVALEDALKVDWSTEIYAKRIRRMDPSFFLLHVLMEFQSREGCSPRAQNRDEDMKLLSSLRDSITTKFGLPDNKIPVDILPMLFSELSPVAAIVGGVLGQEVIKVISNRDAPHNNFFLYNPLESAGVVETIGY
jgi:ubiquitin-like 1-activating enzyme E1 A